MAAESETPRITELHVRMDCNGCVHKIKRTLIGIEGVGEVYVDQANHKITVVGIAEPERIVKAIRKTKKVPTICSHTDPTAEAQPPTPPADPPADAPPPEAAAQAEAEPAPEDKEAAPAEITATDATVIHTVHDYPYNHDIRYDAVPCITEYGHVGSPVEEGRYYSNGYHTAARGKGDGGQITSMFSDENPNACSIA